jgi:Fur family zinc uptake transcriptional regulator
MILKKAAHHSLDHERQDDACAHATQQAQRAGKAMAQAEAVCRAHGARLTPIRRKVLEALYATHKPLGAYDLAEILGPKGRRLAPITVYRALDFLMEQGLVHRLASQNAYVACPTIHGDNEAVAFLICEKCGGVDELASPNLSGTLSGLLSEQQFRPNAHVLEITGHCSHCQDTPAAH